MIKERFARQVDRAILRGAPLIARVPLTPDQLTLCGVGFSLLAAAAFATNANVMGGVLLILAGLGDLIDGVVARARGSASRSGAFLDSSMDRLSDLLVFSGMAVGMVNRESPWGAVLVCWALAGSVMTSYTRAKAEAMLGEFSIGWMERAERFLVLLVAALLDQLEIGLAIVAIGSTATTVQRIVKAREWIEAADREAPERAGSQPADARLGSATEAGGELDAPRQPAHEIAGRRESEEGRQR